MAKNEKSYHNHDYAKIYGNNDDDDFVWGLPPIAIGGHQRSVCDYLQLQQELFNIAMMR